MISYASDTMIPELKHIWQECFMDGESYTDFYYSNGFSKDHTLVWKENGKCASMLTLLPGNLYLKDKIIPVQYVYAVATLKKYRGRGLSSRLLSYVNETLNSRNEGSLLVPASESLFHFYEKNRYKTCFSMKEYTLSYNQFPVRSETEPELSVSSIDAEQYLSLRNRCFLNTCLKTLGFVSFDLPHIEYVLKENEFTGGHACRLSIADRDYSLLYFIKGNKLYIKETTLDDENLFFGITRFASFNGCKEIYVRLPVTSSPKNMPAQPNIKKYGMACIPYSISNAYLNLTLD
jgi:GNAT superfamily N-acetyltransferase